MTKKHFIALADCIKDYTLTGGHPWGLTEKEARVRRLTIDTFVEALANFCSWQNPRFNRSRWLSYIAGECGPNGGKV